jgi:5'-nucleotidase
VLELQDQEHPNRRLFRIYGEAVETGDEPGTDIAAVAKGRIAVTPIHFDLTDRNGIGALERHDLARLIAPAAREVE